MLRKKLAVIAVNLAFAIGASLASFSANAATVPAVSFSGGGISGAGAGTEQGWEFDTNSGITIDSFGVFDEHWESRTGGEDGHN